MRSRRHGRSPPSAPGRYPAEGPRGWSGRAAGRAGRGHHRGYADLHSLPLPWVEEHSRLVGDGLQRSLTAAFLSGCWPARARLILHSQVSSPWSQAWVWSRSQRTAGRRQPGAVHVALRARIRWASLRRDASRSRRGRGRRGRGDRTMVRFRELGVRCRAGGAGRGVAVRGGGAVGVQGGDAPPGGRVAGRGGGQVAGVVAVQQAEPVGFAGCFGLALEGAAR